MSERRRFSDMDILEIGEIFERKLADRASLKKNGHTWKEWLSKVFTPERVVLVFLAVISMAYSFGGDIRAARAQLADAATKADAASSKAEAAATKSEAAAEMIEQLRSDLNVAVQTLQDQKSHQDVFRVQVNERLSLAVTRAEFRSAMSQQILPRLERIEKGQAK